MTANLLLLGVAGLCLSVVGWRTVTGTRDHLARTVWLEQQIEAKEALVERGDLRLAAEEVLLRSARSYMLGEAARHPAPALVVCPPDPYARMEDLLQQKGARP